MALASILPVIRVNPDEYSHQSNQAVIAADPILDQAPIEPSPERLPQESYYGLLTTPPGTYGKVAYGTTTAFILRGSDDFRQKAYNLFATFGSECIRMNAKTGKSRSETREPALRPGDDANTQFFCMPLERAKSALRLYFYGQIYKHKAMVQAIVDDEDGSFLTSFCTNEDEMMREAAWLAESFVHHEMLPDYRAVASWTCSISHAIKAAPLMEHSIVELDGDDRVESD